MYSDFCQCVISCHGFSDNKKRPHDAYYNHIVAHTAELPVKLVRAQTVQKHKALQSDALEVLYKYLYAINSACLNEFFYFITTFTPYGIQ